jgi:hypothetical protein
MGDSILEIKLKIGRAMKNYRMVFTVLRISKWYTANMIKVNQPNMATCPYATEQIWQV